MAPAWIYGDSALGTFARQGATHIDFWCVEPGCLNRHRVAITELIRMEGASCSLVMLARRGRCRLCRRKGCHVEPAPPPAFGQPGYHEWVEKYGAEFGT